MANISVVKSKLGNVQAIAGLSLFSILVLYLAAGYTHISPGIVGLKIQMLGEKKGAYTTLNTGVTWIEPFVYDVVKYDARLKQYILESLPAQTKDGQPIKVDVSLEIGLVDKAVPTLNENIGKNWYGEVVYPAARSALRNSTALKLSDEIYTGEGRLEVQDHVDKVLKQKLEPYGFRVAVNLREISFTNDDFVRTLERKAKAAQEVTIKEREAQAAAQEAVRIKNIAEGNKQKKIKEAEAERENLRLQGEGERLKQQETAKGILAVKLAEAEGARRLTEAYTGPGAKYVAQIEWARHLGPNVKVYGVPTGAPGTSSIIDINSVLQGAFKGVSAPVEK